jgi:hypothetical protein
MLLLVNVNTIIMAFGTNQTDQHKSDIKVGNNSNKSAKPPERKIIL